VREALTLVVAFAVLSGTTAVVYLLTPLAAWLAVRIGAMDQPGARKLHTSPVPRLGGLAIVASVYLALGLVWVSERPISLHAIDSFLAGLALGLLPILSVSLIDDIRPLPALVKLAGHAAGAATGIYFGISLYHEVHLFGLAIELGFMAIPLSLLWLVGVTNAFNIIDGLDGLAAGQAMISCSSLAVIASMSGHAEMAFVGAVVSAALLGFLPFNLHPARVFLGDSGSTAIGYVVACLALSGGLMLSSGFAILLPVLLVGIPVADTLLAILRRAAGRLLGSRVAGIFGPDRDHIHHRVLAAGGGQGAAVITLLAGAVVLVAVGFSSLILSNRASEILLIAVVWAGIMGIIRLDYQEFALIRRGSLLRMFETAPIRQGVAVIVVDMLLVAISAWAAIGLKVNDWGLETSLAVFGAMAFTMAVSTVTVFWFFGIYRWVWRLADMNDLRQAGLAVIISGLLALFFHETLRLHHAPRSLYGIAVIIQLCGSVTIRAAYRMLSDWQSHAATTGTPTLIYGAGYHGSTLARELFDKPTFRRKVVGYLDDNPLKVGRVLNGVDILGGVENLASVVEQTKATSLIISTDAIPQRRIKQVRHQCEALGVECLQFNIVLAKAGERESPSNRDTTSN